PLADLGEQLAEEVRVEAAAEAAIARYDDVADAPDVLARDHERMLVLGRRMRDVADDLAHRTRVRTRGAHQFLRLPDLGGGDHLERARHLARVRDALDLGADFACACHLIRTFVVVGGPRPTLCRGIGWALAHRIRLPATRLLELFDALLESGLD